MFLVLGKRECHEARGPRLLSSPLASALKELTSGRPGRIRLTQKRLRELSLATKAYLDNEVAPHFLAQGLNVVGFTVVYDQIYASIFAANYLRKRYPGFRFLFSSSAVTASRSQRSPRSLTNFKYRGCSSSEKAKESWR